MSDSNRIIIDAANFDRSMPKWATEETLSRLEKLIKTANKDEQRLLKETQKTFKSMEKLDRDLLKSQSQSNTKILKELTKITKLLGAANSPKSNKDSSKSKEDVKKLTQASEKNAKSITSAIEKSEKAADKRTEKITKAIQKAESSSDKQSKQVTDSVENVSKQVKQSSEALATLLKESNDLAKKTEQLLSDLGKQLNKSSSSAPSPSGQTNGTDQASYQNSMVSGINKVNTNLELIQRTLEQQNANTQGLLNNNPSKQDLSDIINRQTREYTRVREATAERSGNAMRDMFETARNASSGQSAGLGALSGIIGTLSTSLGGLVRILRATPLGALANGAMVAASMVNKTAEYAYDAQRDFRDMMDRGFTFNVLGAESSEGGESRLDGITLRRTITDNGVGLETATKVLEHNTRLINDLGISNMFGEIGRVLGDANDSNSFVNQIGLTRDHVAMMVGDFYAIQNRVSNINDDFTALERENLAKEFVTNVRGMSATLGVSMEEIRQHIAEFTKTDEFLATDAFFDGSEILKGFLGSSGLNKEMQDAIFYTMVSPFGAIDERVQAAIGNDIGSVPLFESLQQFKESFNQEEWENSDDKIAYLLPLIEQLTDNVDASVSGMSRQDRSYLSTIDPRGFGNIANLLQNEFNTAIRTEQPDPIERFDNTSEINQRALYLENFEQGLDALKENVFARMADSATGRESIKAIMDVDELMKDSQLAIVEGLGKIADLLDGGPIPKILSMVRTGLRHITELIQSIPLIGNKPKFNEEITGRDAGQFYNQMKGGILSEEQYSRLFQETQTEDGKTVIDLNENIDPEAFKDVMSDALSNASTFEEREQLSALLRNLERGFDDGSVSTSDELSRTLGNMSEDLRYSATSGLGSVDREALEDIFDGHADSFKSSVSTPMREYNEARRAELIAASRGNHAGAWRTGNSLSDTTPELEQYGESSALTTDFAALIEAQSLETQANIEANRRQQQQFLGQTVDEDAAPVAPPEPPALPEVDTSNVDDAEVSRLSDTIQQLQRSLHEQHRYQLQQESRYENEIQSLRDQMATVVLQSSFTSLDAMAGFERVADQEDLLDTSATPEELMSITNRLLAENNDLARLNIQGSTQQREALHGAITDIDMDVRIGEMSVEADGLINLNPLISEISHTRQLLSENLSEIYRVLGGDMFNDLDNTSFNRQSYGSGGNVQAVSNDDIDLFFERLVTQESGNRQFDSNGNPLTSYVGAIGAAQIMPATARDIARQHGIEFDDHRFRYDEEYNKMLGKLHITDLLERYDGDTVLASMAYNAGIGGRGEGQGGVERMMALYGDPRKGEITHEEFLNQIEANHSGGVSSWGVQTVPYARNVSFIGMDRGVTADMTLPDYNDPMMAVSNRINRSRGVETDQSGLLGLMSGQLSEQRRSANTLVEILDHMRGNIGNPDQGLMANIDNGSPRLDTQANVQLPDDSSQFIDRGEVEGMISQAIREYESNMATNAMHNEPAPQNAIDINTPVAETESSNNDSVLGALNSINESNVRVEQAIARNTTALVEVMSKII